MPKGPATLTPSHADPRAKQLWEKTMKLQKLLLSVAAAGLCMAAPNLTQAALITSWDYTVDAAWQNWTPGTVNQFIEGNEDVLEWGTENQGGLSQLRVTRQLDGTITTNDGVGSPGATITHRNFAIDPPELASTDLVVDVTFAPTGNGFVAPFTQTFFIDFDETPNSLPCPYPGANEVPCDDIFILRNPEDLSVSFQVDDYLYTATLVFDEAAFESAGGTIGFEDIDGDGIPELFFLTRENRASILPTNIVITAVQVPEPAALAVAGMGIIGLGLATRRRRRQA